MEILYTKQKKTADYDDVIPFLFHFLVLPWAYTIGLSLPLNSNGA